MLQAGGNSPRWKESSPHPRVAATVIRNEKAGRLWMDPTGRTVVLLIRTGLNYTEVWQRALQSAPGEK